MISHGFILLLLDIVISHGSHQQLTLSPQVERMYNDYMLKKQQEKGDDGHGVTPNYK